LKHFQFVLLEDSQEEETEDSEGEQETVDTLTIKVLQISLKSKEGLTSNRSFKVMGWRFCPFQKIAILSLEFDTFL